MKELEKGIQLFLAENINRQWIANSKIHVYLRKEVFMDEQALNIANIQPKTSTDLKSIYKTIDVVTELNPFPITIFALPYYREVADYLFHRNWQETNVTVHGVIGDMFLDKRESRRIPLVCWNEENK